ncbi:iron-sulfur cluster-binding domain-containing protein [Rhodococcus sp. F64268]|uniref:flavin reductase family protein n=1 Tax=Rhodococcus sp. F64268 TaxID=2926402 RepID=UPI001FF2F398|nr:iron-sulfur cluster-binding domain-containing protein [Rhodococcus sp. F64268]MCK0092354.1 iron-sulfur cluster-binding domain-containing protein [Rhodococcus sp. F64268]
MTSTQAPSRAPIRGKARKLLVGALGALSSPHHLDRYLELADPLLATASNRARITHIDTSVHGSTTLAVRPARPCRFVPGQHVHFAMVIDGVRHVRTFSPAIMPGSREMVFTVGTRHGGLVSGHLAEHARVGDIVEVGDGAGDFVLPKSRPSRLLMISGGSGITPVLSMLGSLAESGATAVTFVHYARSPGHVPRRAELDALSSLPNVEVVLVHTRGEGGHLRGRFERAHLDAVAPWFADTPTYVCGPSGLVGRVRELYAETGSTELLHTEEFTPPAYVVDPDDVSGSVSFAESGIVAANSGATVLEQAENAGLTPEHGCRMGICHTCTAIRSSGCTRDIRTGETDSEPGARIQICVSAPIGNVTVEL